MADINPGALSSNPNTQGSFVEFGGDLYFSAVRGTLGQELYMLDGDSGEVSLVADFYTGSSGSFPGSTGGLVEFSGDFFFGL